MRGSGSTGRRRRGARAAAGLLGILLAARGEAHHVVWLDFGAYNLGAYASVNGNAPPTAADAAAVQALVVANMGEDYAPFDLHFTTVQPANGRFTRVQFLPGANGNLFGTSGGCLCGCCGGIGSWDAATSAAEVYVGFPATLAAWQGANATTARIANTLSHTASHELGHLLGLRHCHSADDFRDSGAACVEGTGINPTSSASFVSADANVNWHVMATFSTGLSRAQRAQRDRFFSVHSSRPVLARELQHRNHWSPLGNVNGGFAFSDLTYGRLLSPAKVKWYNRLSSGLSFNDVTVFAQDRGQASDLFFVRDVTGDHRDDLVIGRVAGATNVRWFVAPSSGSAFGSATAWSGDAGNAGDLFRMGDVDGDGRDDLVYGRPVSATTVTWFVRLSDGSSFAASPATWAADAGRWSDFFFVVDVTRDGRDDLVAVRRTGTGLETSVFESTGDSFDFRGTDDFFVARRDLVLMGDMDQDGSADLVLGDIDGATEVEWDVALSDGCTDLFGCFAGPEEWAGDAGDSGDVFRLGNGYDVFRQDLFYARPVGVQGLTASPDPTSVRWFARESTGASFGPASVWAADAGDEGDCFP